MSKIKWTAPMQRVGLGQPPSAVYWWTFKVYAKFSGGDVVYAEGPIAHNQSQGLSRVLTLGQLYGSDYVVCGTYAGGYGGSSTYCTYDGGLSTKYGAPPSFPPLPSSPPLPAPPFPIYTARFAPFLGPITLAPFNTISPGFRTRVTWVAPSPVFLFGSRGGKPQWMGAPRRGRLGDACSDLNNAVASAKASRNGLQQNLNQVNQAYNEAVAANNQEAIAELYATKQGIQADIADISAKITALEAQAQAACAPPPSTGCKVDDDCGPAGFKCVNGNCVPWDCFKDSDCPAGQRCDGKGNCIPALSASGTGGIGAGGIALLAAAAAAAIFIGMKAPALPKHPGRQLQQNRRRHHRRRRAA